MPDARVRPCPACGGEGFQLIPDMKRHNINQLTEADGHPWSYGRPIYFRKTTCPVCEGATILKVEPDAE